MKNREIMGHGFYSVVVYCPHKRKGQETHFAKPLSHRPASNN